MNSCVEFGKALEFSPVDSSSVGDTETFLLGDVKPEVEADEDMPPLGASFDSASAPPEKPLSPLHQSKRSLSDILRGVKVREDTLQSVVARLGGGTRGLQMLLEHINHWASKSRDKEDMMVAIRREIVRLGARAGAPPSPQRGHRNSEISTISEDGNGSDAKRSHRGKKDCAASSIRAGERKIAWQGTWEPANHHAAYTRALRKSHLLRQRGRTRAHQCHPPPTRLKSETLSKQGRPSCTSDAHQKKVDVESEFSNGNGTGYKFLFQKVLRASDVSNLGRIVLPKKDAEKHLPFLVERDGILLSLQDYHCSKFWTARFRFWPNNKSRMYLLENIGGFVNFHRLQEGDLMLCYRNEQGGYVLRSEKVLPNGKGPAVVEALCPKGAPASPATDTAVTPATHELVDEGKTPCGTPHQAHLANSSSDSLNCTSGDAKGCQDGDGDHQDCFSPQKGSCSGDGKTACPASYYKDEEEVSPAGVPMVYVNLVRHRYLDDNQLLW